MFPTEPIVHAVWRSADAIRANAPAIECCNVEIELGARRKNRYRVVVHLSSAALDPLTAGSTGETMSDDLDHALRGAFAAAVHHALLDSHRRHHGRALSSSGGLRRATRACDPS